MPVVALATFLVTQAPTTLLYQPKVGSSYRFSIDSSIKNQTGLANISAKSNVKILSFTGGVYRVETRLSDIKSGGKDISGELQKKPTYLNYDKYGTVRMDRQSSSGSQDVMSSFSNQALGMQFPKKPVKVGDKWTNVVDLGSVFTTLMKKPGSKAVGKVNMEFKLVQLAKGSAVVTCKLKGTVNMDITNQAGGKAPAKSQVSMSISGNGQYTVERSTGVYLASNMTMEVGTAANGRHFSSTQSVSMKRL